MSTIENLLNKLFTCNACKWNDHGDEHQIRLKWQVRGMIYSVIRQDCHECGCVHLVTVVYRRGTVRVDRLPITVQKQSIIPF